MSRERLISLVYKNSNNLNKVRPSLIKRNYTFIFSLPLFHILCWYPTDMDQQLQCDSSNHSAPNPKKSLRFPTTKFP